MSLMQRGFRIIVKIIFIFFPIGIIYYFFKSIGAWYLSKTPALGVDLYNSVTYVTYHLRNFSLPFNSFKDIWFGGYPFILDIPQLPFYLMMPFVSFYGNVIGVQMYAIASFVLLIVFCYLLFYQLSKNIGLAILLSTLVIFSANMYGALIWAGSIPYFSSQLFFPLGLLLGVLYIKTPNLRYISILVLVNAVGVLVHPFGILAFLIPSLLMLIISAAFINAMSFKRLVKHLLFYCAGLVFSTFIFSYNYVANPLSLIKGLAPKIPSTGSSGQDSGSLSSTSQEIAQFYNNQIALLYDHTSPYLFWAAAIGLGLFISSFIFFKGKRKTLIIIPFILIAIYTILHPWFNLSGTLNFFRHDPYRAFWPFPIAIGALAAVSWGLFFSCVKQYIDRIKDRFQRFAFLAFLYGIIAIIAILFSYYQSGKDFPQLIETLNSKSELTSAYPEILGIKVRKEDQEKIKKQLIPSFLNPTDKNKRLYTSDATVNIWWSSLFDLPLARGYTDPPIGTQVRGGLFWLDIAIANDSIVRDFGIKEEVAKNNALFLIDWNGIHYYEGGRLSSKGATTPPSSYLLKDDIFDAIEEVTTYGALLKYQTPSGKPELRMDLPQILKYYKVNPKYTSPVLYPTNAPAIIIFSSYSGYEDILRLVASENINSRKLIPVYGGEFIDEVQLEQLKMFDGIFLHEYKYKNRDKSFKKLYTYVKEGGYIFIDTGSDVKESKSNNLPDVFPFSSSKRTELGFEWDLAMSGSPITDEVKSDEFGPLIYNQKEWKLTIPFNPGDLRKGAKVIISHKKQPIIIEQKIEKGKVIWSGMNLPYHYNQYKKNVESRLFINILKQFTSIEDNLPIQAKAQWIKSEKVLISTSEKARGVLFKEEGYNGWSANLLSANKKLPIYLAGPTYPGFMYVPLPASYNNPIQLEFLYTGERRFWIASIINFVVVLLLLELVLFNGKLIGFRIEHHSKKLTYNSIKKIRSWWGREDE